jgi:hypothetical protein
VAPHLPQQQQVLAAAAALAAAGAGSGRAVRVVAALGVVGSRSGGRGRHLPHAVMGPLVMVPHPLVVGMGLLPPTAALLAGEVLMVC